MPIPEINNRTAKLIRAVGTGCQLIGDEGTLSLTFEHRNLAIGLLLTTCINGNSIDFWVDENEWCQWVSPVLAIPSFSMVSDEFKDVLAIWTIDTLKACIDIDDFQWPTVKQISMGSLPQGVGWQLCAKHHNRILNFHVIEAPDSWLEVLIENGSITDEQEISSPIMIGAKLVAGWCLLNSQQIYSIQEGNALVLQQQAEITRGEFFLFTHRPLAIVCQDGESGIFSVETLMDTFDDWIDIPTDSLANTDNQISNTLIPVSVEVANLNISINELSQIRPGYLFESEKHYNTPVSLKVGHRIFAFGTLLRIGERLAVRIDTLC
ncbi:FliM/FliN family flagellar motor switch protein [Providencia rettgeri]|nr:FliM/FliN family flagellar motor switch protein [Providencia rettgeri]